MWNKAAKQAAARQSMQLPPHPTKVAAPTATSSSSTLKQQPLLDRLTKSWLTLNDNDMVVDDPAKPAAGWSKHPDDPEFITNSDLLY